MFVRRESAVDLAGTDGEQEPLGVCIDPPPLTRSGKPMGQGGLEALAAQITGGFPEVAKGGDDVGPIPENTPPRFDPLFLIAVGPRGRQQTDRVLSMNTGRPAELIENSRLLFS